MSVDCSYHKWVRPPSEIKAKDVAITTVNAKHYYVINLLLLRLLLKLQCPIGFVSIADTVFFYWKMWFLREFSAMKWIVY